MRNKNIRPGLKVRARGVEVGTVDHMDGDDYIKLQRTTSSDGKHHWIPIDWVEKVDDQAIYLSLSEREFREQRLDRGPLAA